MLWLYRCLTTILVPFMALGFLLRGDGIRAVGQRLGFTQKQSEASLWFHAASVGEFRALKPLLHHPWPFPVTVTLQSRQALVTARKEAPPGAVVLPAPLDAPGVFERFIQRVRPQALILVESELWPGWLQALNHRSIPAVLLDGSLSERSVKRWLALPQLATPVRAGLKRVTVSSDVRRAAFEALRFGPLHPCLPLKLAGERLPVETDLVERWQHWRRADSPLFILANVHPSEIPSLTEIVAHRVPSEAQIIIAPRHPDRVAVFERAFGEGDERLAYWTEFGTLGSLFSLGGCVVVGGGFDPQIGSHNPLESLRFNRPTICGPHGGKQAELINVLRADSLVSQWPDWPTFLGEEAETQEQLTDLSDQAFAEALVAIEGVL